jgi:hypothetical protein
MQGIERLARFVRKAPRGGPFTLQERCLLALAHDIIAKINNLLVLHSFSHTQNIVTEIEFVIFSLV